VSVLVVTATCLFIPLAPRFWPVAAAGVVGALAGTAITPTLAGHLARRRRTRPLRPARRPQRGAVPRGQRGVNLVILLTAPFLGTPSCSG
jgi:hypothetical protein